MLHMIIDFARRLEPIYRHFRAEGRLAPVGLRYVASGSPKTFGVAFHIMDSDDPSLLAQWMARWEDLTKLTSSRS